MRTVTARCESYYIASIFSAVSSGERKVVSTLTVWVRRHCFCLSILRCTTSGRRKPCFTSCCRRFTSLVLLTRKTNFHNVAGRLQTGQKLLPHALKGKHPAKHNVAVTLAFKIAVDNVASVVYGDLPCFGIVYGKIPTPIPFQQHAVGQFFRQYFPHGGFAHAHSAGNYIQSFHFSSCKNK